MKTNKYEYLKVVQGYYSEGWEDLSASSSMKEAKADLKSYRDNEDGTFRIITRRVLIKK